MPIQFLAQAPVGGSAVPVDLLRWLLALLPIVLLLFLLVVRGWGATQAGPVGLLVSVVAAATVFETPAETLIVAGAKGVNGCDGPAGARAGNADGKGPAARAACRSASVPGRYCCTATRAAARHRALVGPPSRCPRGTSTSMGSTKIGKMHSAGTGVGAKGLGIAVREQTGWHERNQLRRHDGSWCTFDNYASPLFGVDGSYLGHVGVSVDVSDQPSAVRGLRAGKARISGDG